MRTRFVFIFLLNMQIACLAQATNTSQLGDAIVSSPCSIVLNNYYIKSTQNKLSDLKVEFFSCSQSDSKKTNVSRNSIKLDFLCFEDERSVNFDMTVFSVKTGKVCKESSGYFFVARYI